MVREVSWRGLPWGSGKLLTAINTAEAQTPIAAARALKGWCALASLAAGTVTGDVAAERCVAWSDAIGSVAEREAIIGAAYLSLVDALDHAADDVERRQRLLVFIVRFEDINGGEVDAARAALSDLADGKDYRRRLPTVDDDDDGIVVDFCPGVPGVRAHQGCEDYDNWPYPPRESPPAWHDDVDPLELGFGLPAFDVGVGVIGQVRFANDGIEADVAATTLSLSLRVAELRVMWPGLDVGARGAPVGGSLLLTPITWMPGRDDGDIMGFGVVAPAVGIDVYADRDGGFRDVGVVVGNTFSLTEAINLRAFYRYSVVGQTQEQPHHAGLLLWINVFSFLRLLDEF